MISASHLVKRYGAFTAVNDLSFEVPRGSIVGFLGPNGAGKSTTLRILAGYLAPTAGARRVAGIDVEEQPALARSKIGYMPEAVPLYPEMRVAEYLSFRAEIKGVARSRRGSRIAASMEDAKVSEVAGWQIGKLSKGYRQRVGLADALVADPPVLILDEPTAGLDPNQIRDVRAVLRALKGERTILLSTHILAEVELICDTAIVIHEGALVAAGTLAAIRASSRARASRFLLRGDEAVIDDALSSLSSLATFEKVAGADDGLVVVRAAWTAADAPRATEEVIAALVARGIGVRGAETEAGSLEEVFAKLTKTAVGAKGGA